VYAGHRLDRGEISGPLRDSAVSNAVLLDLEVGTVTRANGADFDPSIDWPAVCDEFMKMAEDWIESAQAAESCRFDIQRLRPASEYLIACSEIRCAKLPKLIATNANRRILLLERNQWTLSERQIHVEIEKRRSAFPGLARVDVWTVETVTAAPDGTRGYIDFKRYRDDEMIENIAFDHGVLFSRSKDGIPLPV
jgi:hypothetical protein